MQTGREKAASWPEWINIAPKIGQVASMKVLARLHQGEAKERGILINAACPGLINTEASRPWFDDMSSAQDVAWLATLPDGRKGPYGGLIRHRDVVSRR